MTHTSNLCVYSAGPSGLKCSNNWSHLYDWGSPVLLNTCLYYEVTYAMSLTWVSLKLKFIHRGNCKWKYSFHPMRIICRNCDRSFATCKGSLLVSTWITHTRRRHTNRTTVNRQATQNIMDSIELAWNSLDWYVGRSYLRYRNNHSR